MKEGDIVLTPLPQADGAVKTRPAILLRELPPYRDFLVCGISTQLYQQVKGFDELISPADTDFAASGLKSASLDPARVSGSVAATSHYRFNRLSFHRTTQKVVENIE